MALGTLPELFAKVCLQCCHSPSCVTMSRCTLLPVSCLFVITQVNQRYSLGNAVDTKASIDQNPLCSVTASIVVFMFLLYRRLHVVCSQVFAGLTTAHCTRVLQSIALNFCCTTRPSHNFFCFVVRNFWGVCAWKINAPVTRKVQPYDSRCRCDIPNCINPKKPVHILFKIVQNMISVRRWLNAIIDGPIEQ